MMSKYWDRNVGKLKKPDKFYKGTSTGINWRAGRRGQENNHIEKTCLLGWWMDRLRMTWPIFKDKGFEMEKGVRREESNFPI